MQDKDAMLLEECLGRVLIKENVLAPQVQPSKEQKVFDEWFFENCPPNLHGVKRFLEDAFMVGYDHGFMVGMDHATTACLEDDKTNSTPK